MSDKFVYRYDHIHGKLGYEKSLKDCKSLKGWHLGQLKLFIAELFFLCKKYKPGSKVLYIGAASGYHIEKLARLLPELSFDLWDPRQFDIKEQKNIKIFNEMFTEESASKYIGQGDNILFMSDIRCLDIGGVKDNIPEMDIIVNEDNEKQRIWVNIIKPRYAFLKFRTPYGKGLTSYMTGRIYLQAYSPQSTETRLLTNNYTKMVQYDNIEFEEKLAFFNCYVRTEKNLSRWKKIMKINNISNNWDNNLALYVIELYLKKIKKDASDQKVAALFLDIIKYHAVPNIKKYNIVYNNKK